MAKADVNPFPSSVFTGLEEGKMEQILDNNAATF
jgi:hypothetical protein